MYLFKVESDRVPLGLCTKLLPPEFNLLLVTTVSSQNLREHTTVRQTHAYFETPQNCTCWQTFAC